MVVEFRRKAKRSDNHTDVPFADLPISDMFVDFERNGGYARDLNPKRVKHLSEQFDTNAIGTIYLSYRPDGRLAVLDGQHRIEAAKENGLRTLDARVYMDLTIEQEADLYQKFGDYLKQKPIDRFLAALRAGNEDAVAISNVLAEFNLEVLPVTRGNGIHAVEALQYVVRQYNMTMLRMVLQFLTEAFGNNAVALNGSTLKGTAMFLDRFASHPLYNHKKLISRLRRGGFDQYEQRAKAVRIAERCEAAGAWGRALMAIHDSNLSDTNKLDSWLQRSYSQETKQIMTQRLREKAGPARQVAVRREASERAKAIHCTECPAGVGFDCDTPTGFAHKSRIERARRQRATQRAKVAA